LVVYHFKLPGFPGAAAFTFSETRKKLNRSERKARRVSGEHIGLVQ
jgi:hypothetical protein